MAIRSEELADHPSYSLGEMLAKARRDAGLEQEAVATALGVSRPLVSKWERDRAVPDVREYRLLAVTTGARWLLDLSGQNWKRLTVIQGGSQPELDFDPPTRPLSLVR